jgi:hypothetical protein
MMAHAAASRRSLNEMAFDMPYSSLPRRMMYGNYHGCASDSMYHCNDAELGHYLNVVGASSCAGGPGGTAFGARRGMPGTAIPAQTIDPAGMAKAGRGAPRPCDVKKELVIFPRRKAGQSKRQVSSPHAMRRWGAWGTRQAGMTRA